ncbi:CoA transferase [Sandaracinobacter neustonicus]|uniref:CoA transferase n=1 Tax=Sandaracinobacter neustonicus TaxID=1715348 RepID=A0A501XNF4_9SPHN|nr:CoA transferase [Sandaracinobacter neustonicus]TPE61813.1 CoA transferase [Sandaracinobacter neustonicus]
MSSEPQAAGPLSGLLVIDLTRVLAGPYATMVLADLGARVIKVEAPGVGDDARQFPPFLAAGDSGYFASINCGKESIALNLKASADLAILEALLARADVLVENFRPGTMEKLGLSYEVLKERFPRLIYAAASGFGHTGPESSRPAYDLVVQAMGGLMSMTGQPDNPPTRVGTSIGDIAAGMFTVIGIQAALIDRQRTGLGQKVDVAMLDCQLAILESAIARYQVTGQNPTPLGSRHPAITPFQAFRCADRAIVIAAGNDNLWAACRDALGLQSLSADPRYASVDSRNSNQPALAEAIETRLLTAPADHWLALLAAAGVPSGPINGVAEAIAQPQVQARNMLVETETPGGAPLKIAGNPVKLSGHADPASRRPAPRLDADRAKILAELGSADKMKSLAELDTLAD